MSPRPATGPKGVAVLGSTGSIGTTALRVLDRQRERRVQASGTYDGVEDDIDVVARRSRNQSLSPALPGVI